VLYLAEVQKKSGFISSGKAEFKLLACQRSEQNWSAVSGDETLPAPDDATYNSGALVMIELTGNRQVQRHYEAGRSLVSILQNFSSLNKKFKTQEEEIDQWKESLTYQSQELNRRELELEARQEELEQAEADLEKVEAQQTEVEQARAQVEALRQEYERKNQELEGAWAHLNGEIQKLEEHQTQMSSGPNVDEAQTQQIQNALERLMGTVAPTDGLRQHLTEVINRVTQQQTDLASYRTTLDQYREQLTAQRPVLETQRQALGQQQQEYQRAEATLDELKTTLHHRQALLELKHNQRQMLSDQLEQQGSLYQQVYELLNTNAQVRLSKKVNMATLEALSTEELQTVVNDLEKDLDKMSRFVSDQEEELKLQQQAIDEIKARIESASEYDRLQLDAEIADEQDRYRMLNETLVGQRRNLLEREEILSQHRAILLRRQGLTTEESPSIDSAGLEQLLENIDSLRQKFNEQGQALDQEILDLQTELETCRQQVEHQAEAKTSQRTTLENAEAALTAQQVEMAQLEGQVNLYEAWVQQMQEHLQQIHQKLEETLSILSQFQEAGDYQLQAIAELKQTLQVLLAEPFAAAAS
jgi:chromosome segregation ATPase